MYADFKGAFRDVDHRIMFKHMRQLGMPPMVYLPSTTSPPTAPPHLSTSTAALYGAAPSPPSCSPFSSPPSSDGSQLVAEATALVPPPLTLSPQNPRRPTLATDSPTTSASQRVPLPI
jgi:hypothetical protein